MSAADPRTAPPVARFKTALAVTALVLLFAASCAKIVAPPGGPEDKESPTVLSATPHNLATGLGPESEFTIYFSEPLSDRGLEKSVFISPRQLVEPKIKVKGERLIISLADTLSENQTYVLTIAAGLTDLRGNKLGASRSFAFSRGQQIDTGAVSGVVTNNDEGAEGYAVALYKGFSPTTLGDLDSLYPNYFSASGDGGEFRFEYLPPADYFLLAFKDNDKNQLFRYGVDEFAIGTEPIDLRIGNTENQELRLQKQDTAAFSVLSVTNGDNRLVRISLSRAIAEDIIIRNSRFVQLQSLADTTQGLSVSGIRALSGAKSAKYKAYFAGLEVGDYSLRIGFDSFYTDGRVWSAETVTPFSYAPTVDTIGPEIVSVTPTVKYAPWDSAVWRVEFNEPVTVDSSAIKEPVVAFSNGGSPGHNLLQSDPFSLECQITEPLIAGESYQFTLPESALVDLSGNRAGDSALSGVHRVWPDDSLGSLTLAVTTNSAGTDSVDADRFEFILRRLPNETYRFTTSLTDSLQLAIPAGDYIVEARLISSLSEIRGVRFDGSLYPLRWADRRAFYPDTVHVRPRFDSEKITITIE